MSIFKDKMNWFWGGPLWPVHELQIKNKEKPMAGPMHPATMTTTTLPSITYPSGGGFDMVNSTTGTTTVNPTWATTGGILTTTGYLETEQDIAMKRIAMRMNWDPHNPCPILFIAVYTPEGHDVTYVIICNKKEKPFIIEDDAALFPSDRLITQLRLLEK